MIYFLLFAVGRPTPRAILFDVLNVCFHERELSSDLNYSYSEGAHEDGYLDN